MQNFVYLPWSKSISGTATIKVFTLYELEVTDLVAAISSRLAQQITQDNCIKL